MTNKTALIVVDLQNQYTDPKGSLYYPMTGETMPRILEGISSLRDKGVYIVYAMAEADGTEFSLDTEVLKRRDPVPMRDSWEAGADARLEIKETDRLMTHYASSAFFGTDLARHLRERGIVNVITCGVKSTMSGPRRRMPCGIILTRLLPPTWWPVILRSAANGIWRN